MVLPWLAEVLVYCKTGLGYFSEVDVILDEGLLGLVLPP